MQVIAGQGPRRSATAPPAVPRVVHGSVASRPSPAVSILRRPEAATSVGALADWTRLLARSYPLSGMGVP